MVIQRIEDVIPNRELIEELKILGSLPFRWIDIIPLDPPEFEIRSMVGQLPPFVYAIWNASRSASTLCGLLSFSEWLKDCPRIIRPSAEQAESLAQVAIEIELKDYEQPFPCLCVEIPGNKVFKAAICYRHSPDILAMELVSHDHLDDINTMIRQREGTTVERALEKLDPEDDMESLEPYSVAAQRVALNMCMCLMQYGHKESPAFPKELAMDRMYAKEDSDRGRKAKVRVKEALHRVDFDHEVVIRRPSPRKEDHGESGRTVPGHWVRGHWKMVPYGPLSVVPRPTRKTLIKPYLTHAGDALGPMPGVIYTSKR